MLNSIQVGGFTFPSTVSSGQNEGGNPVTVSFDRSPIAEEDSYYTPLPPFNSAVGGVVGNNVVDDVNLRRPVALPEGERMTEVQEQRAYALLLKHVALKNLDFIQDILGDDGTQFNQFKQPSDGWNYDGATTDESLLDETFENLGFGFDEITQIDAVKQIKKMLEGKGSDILESLGNENINGTEYLERLVKDGASGGAYGLLGSDSDNRNTNGVDKKELAQILFTLKQKLGQTLDIELPENTRAVPGWDSSRSIDQVVINVEKSGISFKETENDNQFEIFEYIQNLFSQGTNLSQNLGQAVINVENNDISFEETENNNRFKIFAYIQNLLPEGTNLSQNNFQSLRKLIASGAKLEGDNNKNITQEEFKEILRNIEINLSEEDLTMGIDIPKGTDFVGTLNGRSL